MTVGYLDLMAFSNALNCSTCTHTRGGGQDCGKGPLPHKHCAGMLTRTPRLDRAIPAFPHPRNGPGPAPDLHPRQRVVGRRAAITLEW